MFKPGDKVVCIKKYNYFTNIKKFKVGKIYTILRIVNDRIYDVEGVYFNIKRPDTILNNKFDYYFTSIKKNRKEKLEKLCSKLAI